MQSQQQEIGWFPWKLLSVSKLFVWVFWPAQSSNTGPTNGVSLGAGLCVCPTNGKWERDVIFSEYSFCSTATERPVKQRKDPLMKSSELNCCIYIYTFFKQIVLIDYMWPWTTKPVISSTGIFVAIAHNTLNELKLWAKIIRYLVKNMLHEDIL